jgi:hypothetical protein
MIRIVVGGLAAQEIAELAAQVGAGQVEARAVDDIAGTRQVAEGQADYYLGACATGGGGALAMAIAILGYHRCFTASMAGRPPKEQEIQRAVAEGKQAFGFTTDHLATAVPLIVHAILTHDGQK